MRLPPHLRAGGRPPHQDAPGRAKNLQSVFRLTAGHHFRTLQHIVLARKYYAQLGQNPFAKGGAAYERLFAVSKSISIDPLTK